MKAAWCQVQGLFSTAQQYRRRLCMVAQMIVQPNLLSHADVCLHVQETLAELMLMANSHSEIAPIVADQLYKIWQADSGSFCQNVEPLLNQITELLAFGPIAASNDKINSFVAEQLQDSEYDYRSVDLRFVECRVFDQAVLIRAS
jgi:hypothetical protein